MAHTHAPIKLVLGAAYIQEIFFVSDDEAIAASRLDHLIKSGVTNLDTAQIYGNNEELLGKSLGDRKFNIDTKFGAGFTPGQTSLENIIAHGTKASEQLGPIDVYYLHAPEPNVPWEVQLDGIQQLYDAGVFKRFGISNFSPEQTETVYNIQKARGGVLPSVFQGNYNAFARGQEDATFPKLRELGISFYAYSPLAGGLLAKTREQLGIAGGRWDPSQGIGKMYHEMYKDVVEGLDDWETLATKEGISPGELGYRWIRYHSALDPEHDDAILFGVKNEDQLDKTLAWLNAGPLSDEAVVTIDKIWEKIKDKAPLDNYHSYAIKQQDKPEEKKE